MNEPLKTIIMIGVIIFVFVVGFMIVNDVVEYQYKNVTCNSSIMECCSMNGTAVFQSRNQSHSRSSGTIW